MSSQNHRIRRAPLWIAMAACYLPAAGFAVAGELGAGQSKTVVPGEAAEAWILRNGASLTLSPLSAALSIAADSSSVLIDAGNVSASASDAIALTGQSAATITRARRQCHRQCPVHPHRTLQRRGCDAQQRRGQQ